MFQEECILFQEGKITGVISSIHLSDPAISVYMVAILYGCKHPAVVNLSNAFKHDVFESVSRTYFHYKAR